MDDIGVNSRCPDFRGNFNEKFGCRFFIPTGACKRPDKFMCHVWLDTGKQPVEDDIPLQVKTVLENSNTARVVSHKQEEKKESGIDRLKDILGANY